MRRLSIALGSLLGFALFMGAIWAGCSTFLKNNSAYERGIETALADPVLAKALGAPVEEGWFLNGSVEGDGMDSRGTWLVRLRGEERSGTLRILGFKSGGDWRVVGMSLDAGDVRYDYVPGSGFREAREDTPGNGPPDILGG